MQYSAFCLHSIEQNFYFVQFQVRFNCRPRGLLLCSSLKLYGLDRVAFASVCAQQNSRFVQSPRYNAGVVLPNSFPCGRWRLALVEKDNSRYLTDDSTVRTCCQMLFYRACPFFVLIRAADAPVYPPITSGACGREAYQPWHRWRSRLYCCD